MIEILAAGKLAGKPEQLRSKSGITYVRAKLRVPLGADEVVFVRLSAFAESACAALLALDDGDAVSVAGTLKVGVWTPPGGEPRPNLDAVVAQVLTAYHVRRKRDAVQAAGDADRGEPPLQH